VFYEIDQRGAPLKEKYGCSFLDNLGAKRPFPFYDPVCGSGYHSQLKLLNVVVNIAPGINRGFCI